MKVLIVDNKKENIDFLTFLLQRNKFEVTYTLNGKEALKELESKQFDLIISDVLMPVMDGFQLCYECKNNERFKHTPFIFYTATFISEEDEAFAMALGAEAYIKKTTDSIQFLKTIKEVVQKLKPYNQLSEKVSITDKTVYLKLYNERLINKLEKKALDLEKWQMNYHNLFNNVNDMIFSLGETGHFLEVSKRCEIFGYLPEDLIGMNITSLIDLKDKSHLSKHIEQTKKLKLNSHENFEFELIRKDKMKAVVELSLSTVYEDKDFVGIYGILRDITARRRSEEAKAQVDAFNQALIKSIPFGMSIVDEEGNLLFMNEILINLFGKSAIGTKCWDLHIGNTKQCKNCPLKSNLKIGETGVIESHEIIKGKIFLISYTAMMFKGKKALMGVYQDITSKKQMELKQEILHNITNAVLITDNLEELLQFIFSELSKIMKTNNFYIALYNEETKMLEIPYSNDKIDQGLNCFSPEKTLTGYVLKTKKSLYADKKVFKELERIGEIEHIGTTSNIWIGAPLKTKDKTIGVIAVQSYEGEEKVGETDLKMLEYVSPQISLAIERKIFVDDIKTALELSEESDKLKSAFLKNVSHEIRTPMNGILGFANLLKEAGLSGEEQKEYIEIIERSGNRMINTLTDLMDISKIATGQVSVHMEDINLGHFLKSIYNNYKTEAVNNGLQLILTEDSNAGEIIIQSDLEKLETIFAKLLNNAIKYSDSGQIILGYAVVGQIIEFFVKDKGIGIPENRIEAIFDRFVQADIADTRVFEGAGLGLSITKAYVEMLGGEIWVESEENVGTQFYFTLPYPLNEVKIEPKVKYAKIAQDPIPLKLKILIAEDDMTSSLHLDLVTRNISRETLYAKTGIEAVEICRENPDIDLVLMDIRMPLLSGIEATKIIRSFNKEIIIIAQTAFALAGDQAKVMESGCNNYISKPINKQKLEILIDNHLKFRNLN